MARAGSVAGDDLLPECFAIVAEAIDRRLGAWRLLGGEAIAEDEGEDGRVIAEAIESVGEQRRHRQPGDILLPPRFYEAVRRRGDADGLRFRATDEQLLAGVHLFRGRVVQMDAGEGKTVAIAFAAALHAVLGRRVHVITANDYLAERDAALLGPVYRSLGLSSGAVPAYMEEAERRHVYRRSIVYGAMRELGFDHLRDNLKTAAAGRVQPPLDVAIVDEADHALIDEAFTPLIISGSQSGGTRAAVRVDAAVAQLVERQREDARNLAARLDAGSGDTDPARPLAALLLADPDNPVLEQRLAEQPRLRRRAWALAEDEQDTLTAGLYYAVHPNRSLVTLTEKGRDYLETRLGPVFGAPAPDAAGGPGGNTAGWTSLSAARRHARRYGLANQVSQALRANLLLKRDVDYLVDDDAIVLIDPHTGRPKPDSIYQHGLQSAVEAREGVTVQPERETLAQVSVSGFMSRYRQVAGITGTAAPAAAEFRRRYGLEVAVVPPVRQPLRATRPPVVYATRDDKLAAIVDAVACRHRAGQPVLIGTRTVEQSEELSALLDGRDVPHRVLNAVTTHAEASIVRGAGSFGAVTVATHMAGRGTDIVPEAGLDARIARGCVAGITRLLAGEADPVATVEVGCPSPEQAAVLESELAAQTGLVVDRCPEGLRVTRQDPGDVADASARVEFALGLCVIGTEVHDSSRISLQLDGRSGRQGQFGLALTLLSMEDRLVNTDAGEMMRLSHCRGTDAAGRVCYSGPDVTRRIKLLQGAADREGEVQRAMLQDYSAELDRQTHLYHRRRQQLIEMAEDPVAVMTLLREIVDRVARRLADRFVGSDADDEYPQRFARLRDELLRYYAVDCSELRGCDLGLLPEEVDRLLSERMARQSGAAGAAAFPELARLLLLGVCGELWPGHIAALRDSLAVELLGTRSHKSSVAAHIRRCDDHRKRFWGAADEEFLSRLALLPVGEDTRPPDSPVYVSTETALLLESGGASDG